MADLSRPPTLRRQKTVYVTGNGPTEPIETKYKLGRQIGVPGISGKAHICYDLNTNERFACKIVNKARFHHVSALDKCWADMRAEIAILRELNHPNIVKFVDVFEDRSKLQIVTELCSGGELFDKITEKGHYTEKEAANVFIQLLDGLRYMHSRDIVHCDLKPDNFLFASKAEDAAIKIIDFGMSKRCPRLKSLNNLVGTAYYTAPEILQKKYGHQADMWSMGVVLFVMVFGYPPFYVDPSLYGRKENDMIYKKILKGFTPTTKRGYGPWFPSAIPASDEVKDLIAHLLQLDPAERPTAAEALDHVWIRERENNENILPETVVSAIQSFRNSVGFKQTVCHAFRDKLRPYQVKAVEESFKRMDTNNDQKISLEEFKTALKEHAETLQLSPRRQSEGGAQEPASPKLTDQDIENIFSQIDINDSGFICYEELLTATYAEHLQSQDERLFEQFTLFDLNGDGYISPDEMREVLSSQTDFDAEKIDEAMQHIRDADLNFDGKIDYQEFLQALHPELNTLEETQTHYIQEQARSSGGGPPMMSRGGQSQVDVDVDPDEPAQKAD